MSVHLAQQLPPDLEDEITSINSIYNEDTLTQTGIPVSEPTDEPKFALILKLPRTPISILINFPSTYPADRPTIERTIHVDDTLPKGSGIEILHLARTVLKDLTHDPSQAGSVVIYELIENLESRIADSQVGTNLSSSVAEPANNQAHESLHPSSPTAISGLRASQWANVETNSTTQTPPATAAATMEHHWILSEPLVSHKSTFLARACAVSSPQEAHDAIMHLVATDKRAAKATHNMWAYRMRGNTAAAGISNSVPASDIVYADADDDGEDGAGAKLAALLQAMGAWGVLVVVSRWYGGVKLGPERWRLIGNVGREVLVKGGEAGSWQLDKVKT